MTTKKLVVGLAVAALLTLGSVSVTAAVDTYSGTYTVNDYVGNDYQVQAMVRNTPYSDHIYVSSFWLHINVLQSGDTAVCDHFTFSRTSPYPSGGSMSSYDSPFPVNYGDGWQWTWTTFYQDMYWSSGNPVWSHHLTSGESVCGTAAIYRSAGVAMYRDSGGWFNQEIE